MPAAVPTMPAARSCHDRKSAPQGTTMNEHSSTWAVDGCWRSAHCPTAVRHMGQHSCTAVLVTPTMLLPAEAARVAEHKTPRPSDTVPTVGASKFARPSNLPTQLFGEYRQPQVMPIQIDVLRIDIRRCVISESAKHRVHQSSRAAVDGDHTPCLLCYEVSR
jgi:hypothetical protein